jgi:hypothetical protein
MTIILTQGSLLYIGSGIVFATTLCFHVAYYIGRFVGRMERAEADIVDLRKDVTTLKVGT